MKMKGLFGIGVLVLSLLLRLGLGAAPIPPIHFIENKNQWPSAIDFMARVSGGNMMVERPRRRR